MSTDIPLPTPAVPPGPDPAALKQVLVIRRGDIKMRQGKTAAQAAHAAMTSFIQGCGGRIETREGQRSLVVPLDDEAFEWLQGAHRKVCVYVPSEEELLALHEKARAAGLRCALIRDNGLTEFDGPTYTAVAIGPHRNDLIDPLTGHLPLL